MAYAREHARKCAEGARSARLSLAITPGWQTQHRCVWSAHMSGNLNVFSSPTAHPFSPHAKKNKKNADIKPAFFLFGRDEGARSARLSLAITLGWQTQHCCVWSAHMDGSLSKFSSPTAHSFSPPCKQYKAKKRKQDAYVFYLVETRGLEPMTSRM